MLEVVDIDENGEKGLPRSERGFEHFVGGPAIRESGQCVAHRGGLERCALSLRPLEHLAVPPVAQLHADARAELVQPGGSHDVVVGAGEQAPHGALFVLVRGRNEDDGSEARVVHHAKVAAQLEAGDFGQHDVE